MNSPTQGLSKFVAARNFVAIVKLDTAGRKGKSVTVIEGLPKNELFCEAMAKALKAKCGSGGTYHMRGRDGTVEVQGDQREKVRAYLDSESIKYKIQA